MSTDSNIRNWRIYCVTNVNNNKKYVGQTCRTPHERWRKHVWLACTRNANTRFYEAIRKHGSGNFRISILEDEIQSLTDANLAEKRWITELSTLDEQFGYNMTDGGDQPDNSGWIMSPDACAKISASKLGKPLMSRRLRTQEEDRPIVEAFKSGKSRNQICKDLNVTTAKVQKALARWKFRVEPDLKVGKKHQYDNSGQSLQTRADELNSPIIMMFESGKKRKEIALELGVSYDRVKQAILRHRRRLSGLT